MKYIIIALKSIIKSILFAAAVIWLPAYCLLFKKADTEDMTEKVTWGILYFLYLAVFVAIPAYLMFSAATYSGKYIISGEGWVAGGAVWIFVGIIGLIFGCIAGFSNYNDIPKESLGWEFLFNIFGKKTAERIDDWLRTFDDAEKEA